LSPLGRLLLLVRNLTLLLLQIFSRLLLLLLLRSLDPGGAEDLAHSRLRLDASRAAILLAEVGLLVVEVNLIALGRWLVLEGSPRRALRRLDLVLLYEVYLFLLGLLRLLAALSIFRLSLLASLLVGLDFVSLVKRPSIVKLGREDGVFGGERWVLSSLPQRLIFLSILLLGGLRVRRGRLGLLPRHHRAWNGGLLLLNALW